MTKIENSTKCYYKISLIRIDRDVSVVFLRKETGVSGENTSVRSRDHTLPRVLTPGIELGFALMRDQSVNH